MSQSVKNLNEIIMKLKEIDNVFKYGKKMIPIVEGFVSFISDFVPFVEQMSGSIQDTRSKIPEASNQIDKVTSATELAMTEVLDKIDEITIQLDSITELIESMDNRKSSVEESFQELYNIVENNANAYKLLKDIEKSIDFSPSIEIIKNKIKDITANTERITMSLQVQDITAQQLSAVNHFIISVQHKLGSLLEDVDSESHDQSEDLNMDKLPDVHFDANASYETKSEHQRNVDSIIKTQKASQEEIDKLFS
jgi:chemotaxis regulatin CheY-phosphate phosphatase CheZ